MSLKSIWSSGIEARRFRSSRSALVSFRFFTCSSVVIVLVVAFAFFIKSPFSARRAFKLSMKPARTGKRQDHYLEDHIKVVGRRRPSTARAQGRHRSLVQWIEAELI